jgi:hypothetical protein
MTKCFAEENSKAEKLFSAEEVPRLLSCIETYSLARKCLRSSLGLVITINVWQPVITWNPI